jgi:hypothetical protein
MMVGVGREEMGAGRTGTGREERKGTEGYRQVERRVRGQRVGAGRQEKKGQRVGAGREERAGRKSKRR